MSECARITHRVLRLNRSELRRVEREVERLLAEGYLCEVCRWKLLLIGSFWCREKLPLVALRFSSQVPPRSQLQAAGRDLEAEIEAAIRPYRRI